MGCSSSKNEVAALDTESSKSRPDTGTSRRKSSARSNADQNNTNGTYPPGEAFVISLEDTVDDSSSATAAGVGGSLGIIKKHPPKRLQKLLEQAEAAEVDPSKRIEDLEEKLAKAELRRQKYIQEKVENIVRTTQTLTKPRSQTDGDGDGDGDGDAEGPDGVWDTTKESPGQDAVSTPSGEIKRKAIDDDSKQALINAGKNKL